MIARGGSSPVTKLLQYVWENYIEFVAPPSPRLCPDRSLIPDTRVVLIGHGTACQAIMNLVNDSRMLATIRRDGELTA